VYFSAACARVETGVGRLHRVGWEEDGEPEIRDI
jgi:hypothetical protein